MFQEQRVFVAGPKPCALALAKVLCVFGWRAYAAEVAGCALVASSDWSPKMNAETDIIILLVDRSNSREQRECTDYLRYQMNAKHLSSIHILCLTTGPLPETFTYGWHMDIFEDPPIILECRWEVLKVNSLLKNRKSLARMFRARKGEQ